MPEPFPVSLFKGCGTFLLIVVVVVLLIFLSWKAFVL
jgi:hypothetical protein